MRKLFAIHGDLGDGHCMFEWSPRGNLIAAAGNKRVVNIYDRSGKLYGEIHLAAREVAATDAKQCCCLQLQWDASGDVLAVLPAGCSFVYTWTASTRDLQKLETDFRAQEATMIAWSRSSSGSPVLAVGTVKGNLQLYNIRERRRTPIVGKHTKRVFCGVWSSSVLAMAALDKTVTVSDQAGETLKTIAFKGEPLELCVASCKDDDKGPSSTAKKQDDSFSLITSKKVLYIMQGSSSSAAGAAPLELSFLESYGPLAHHLWFGDGFVMAGFKSGQVVVVSSLSKEISEEVHCHRPLEMLTDMAYCAALSRVAVGGGSSVKLIDVGAEYGEVAGEGVELPPGHSVEKVGWGQEGQILTVSSSNGLLACYLAALPTVFSAHGTKVANLTSIGEVTVLDTATRSSTAVAVDCEPALCSLGPAHLAVGMNNQVLFYSHGAKGPVGLVSRRSYLGGVQAVHLNATHAAVLTEGRLLLHTIAARQQQQQGLESDDSEADLCLPKVGAHHHDPITCAALSQHFVVTGTAAGSLCYHMLQDGELAVVNEYRHSGGGITALFPQPAGPRLVLADSRMQVGLYSPLNDEFQLLPGFEGTLQQLLWDVEDPNVFVAANSSSELWAYLFTQQSVSGPKLELLCKTVLLKGHTPVVLAGGRLSMRMKSGAIDGWMLESHKPLYEQGSSGKQLAKRLAAAIKLNRQQEARAAAAALGTADGWRQLGTAAMQLLDVELAVAAFRQVGDASMVMSLASLIGVEDRNLLAGSLLVLMERDYNQAQELLLRSSRPLAALEMRRDLKHWPQALSLAQQLAPVSIAALSKEHAAMLEMVGEHAEARSHYQQALESVAASGSDAQLQQSCLAGVTRTTLHLGDLRAGRQLALQANSSSLWKECGLILEQMQQLPEAAEMYERAGMVEKAASIHIASKNFSAAQPLMAQVKSAKLQLQYAKAKESEGRWADAAAAYEAAGDLDAVVRLCLEKLNDTGRACALTRKSRSASAAATVARHCLAAGDVALSVEFLLLAGQLDQAFDVAAAKGAMDVFAQLVADNATAVDEVVRIAQYYSQRGEPEKAADMWAKAGQHEQAVELYVQVCSQSSLTKAIAVVEDSRNPQLAPAVLDALAACEGLAGHVRDALRFRLNLAMGQLGDAAKDALELAQFEQSEGNYKLAHSKLYSTLQQLRGLGAPVPLELRNALALLHSYVLVKSLVGLGDHLGAARMLVRVAGSISRFPKHIVPILTSTVIECQRAGLKKTAFDYASMLMRPEYRSQVSDKYRKKIELMVRKPDRGEEPGERLAACPFCQLPGSEGELQCISCQNTIPFDIATGNRMTLQDWCECPSCHLPCSSQAFLAILAAEGRCPMCNEAVRMQEVRQMKDPLASYQPGQAAAAGTLGIGGGGVPAQGRPAVALPPPSSS